MQTVTAIIEGLSHPQTIIGLAVLIALLLIANLKLNLRDKLRAKAAPRKSSQTDALGEVAFERQNLMNKTEFRVFATVEQALARNARGYRVMAQTCLGEVLRTVPGPSDAAARKAYAVINCKRLDIAIIDRSGLLALAIEVQGAGHYQSARTFVRDAVKKEALRRAGVDLLEVTPDWDSARIAREVSQRLGLAMAA